MTYQVLIHRDPNPEDPRDGDNFGTMVCFHNRYKLGDSHDYVSGDFDGWESLKKGLKKDYDAKVILPLYMYDHSGLIIGTDNTIYPFNDRFDAGQIGYILASKKDIRTVFNVKRVTKGVVNNARARLLYEIKNYNQYLQGDVWGYEILNSDGEQVSSCWGHYDKDDCKEAADSHIQHALMT